MHWLHIRLHNLCNFCLSGTGIIGLSEFPSPIPWHHIQSSHTEDKQDLGSVLKSSSKDRDYSGISSSMIHCRLCNKVNEPGAISTAVSQKKTHFHVLIPVNALILSPTFSTVWNCCTVSILPISLSLSHRTSFPILTLRPIITSVPKVTTRP